MIPTHLITKASSIKAGDTLTASQFLDDIGRVLDQEELATDDRRRLYKLRKKWTSRATGRDARWMTVGSKPGRPSAHISRGHITARHEEDSDPLLASILKKFGEPRGREDEF